MCCICMCVLLMIRNCAIPVDVTAWNSFRAIAAQSAKLSTKKPWQADDWGSSLSPAPPRSLPKRVSGLSPHQFRWHQFEVYAVWQLLSAKNKERIKKLFAKNNINDCRSKGSSWEWGDSIVVLMVVMVPECINRNIIKMPSGLAVRFFHIIATAGKLLAKLNSPRRKAHSRNVVNKFLPTRRYKCKYLVYTARNVCIF